MPNTHTDSTVESATNLESLPDEILLIIMQMCGVIGTSILANVNKRFKGLAAEEVLWDSFSRDENLWREIFRFYFPNVSPKLSQKHVTWRHQFWKTLKSEYPKLSWTEKEIILWIKARNFVFVTFGNPSLTHIRPQLPDLNFYDLLRLRKLDPKFLTSATQPMRNHFYSIVEKEFSTQQWQDLLWLEWAIKCNQPIQEIEKVLRNEHIDIKKTDIKKYEAQRNHPLALAPDNSVLIDIFLQGNLTFWRWLIPQLSTKQKKYIVRKCNLKENLWIKKLLCEGEPRLEDKLGASMVLQIAVYFNDRQTIESLIKEMDNSLLLSLLCQVVEWGNLQLLQLLWDCRFSDFSAHINDPNDIHGRTLLEFAVLGGNLACVNFLLENGALVNQSVILCAVNLNRSEMLKILWPKINIAGIDADKIEKILVTAASLESPTIMTYFIVQGIDVQSDGMQAAFLSAAEIGHTPMVRLLLDSGVDISAKNANGETAIHLAAANGHSETVKLLVERGLSAITINEINETDALDVAVENGQADVVEYLLKSIPPLNDCWKHELMRIAMEKGHHEVIIKLLAHGIMMQAAHLGVIKTCSAKTVARILQIPHMCEAIKTSKKIYTFKMRSQFVAILPEMLRVGLNIEYIPNSAVPDSKLEFYEKIDREDRQKTIAAIKYHPRLTKLEKDLVLYIFELEVYLKLHAFKRETDKKEYKYFSVCGVMLFRYFDSEFSYESLYAARALRDKIFRNEPIDEEHMSYLKKGKLGILYQRFLTSQNPKKQKDFDYLALSTFPKM